MRQRVIAELERISGLIEGEIFCIIDKIMYNDKLLKKRIVFSTSDIGYKLRPYLVIKGATLFGRDESFAIPFAAGVELLQLSTLVIDDILDDSKRRNNADTCLKRYGIKESILIGECLHNLSIKHIVSNKNALPLDVLMTIVDLLSDSYHAITVGQFYDIMMSYKEKSLLEEESLRLINLTTGVFIKNSLLIGAVLCGVPNDIMKILTDYGHYLGIAYQLRDDIIDIIGEEKMTGKPKLIDIDNGRYRIPVIFFLNNCKKDQKKEFKEIVDKKNKTNEDKIKLTDMLIDSSAIEYSIKKTSELCEKARCCIAPLEESVIKDELLELADIIACFDN